MMGNLQFLGQLKEVDTTKIPRETAVKARDMLADLTVEQVKCVCSACCGIHEWNQWAIKAVLDSADSSDTTQR